MHALERAIACYTAALQVHTRDAFPADCEQTLLNAVSQFTAKSTEDPTISLHEMMQFEHKKLTARLCTISGLTAMIRCHSYSGRFPCPQ